MEETPSVMPGKVQAITLMRRVRLYLLVEFLGSAHRFYLGKHKRKYRLSLSHVDISASADCEGAAAWGED